MMPLVVGNKKTVSLIIAYSLTLLPVTLLMSYYYSLFFGTLSSIMGICFIYLALDLRKYVDHSRLLEKKAQTLFFFSIIYLFNICLLYTSPSPRDLSTSRMPSSA